MKGIATGRRSAVGARRRALVALLVLGIGLALAPLAFQMFERGPEGRADDGRVQAVHDGCAAERLSAPHQRHRRRGAARPTAAWSCSRATAPAAHKRFDERFPGFAQFREDWPPINDDMTDLMDKIQANVGNYEAIVGAAELRALPVVLRDPGRARRAARARRACSRRGARPSCAGRSSRSGSASCSRPVALQMFDRAPKGAEHDGGLQDDRDAPEGRDDPGLLRHDRRRPGRAAPGDRARRCGARASATGRSPRASPTSTRSTAAGSRSSTT